MVDKIRRAAGIETPLDAAVLSTPVPNAFALPGGKVYLLDGLLQKARNPDEVAGVSPTSSATCTTATTCARSSRRAAPRSWSASCSAT